LTGRKFRDVMMKTRRYNKRHVSLQRSHQNTLEYLPNVLALQALMGLQFPVTAAGLGVGWAVARILYSLGYSTGDPGKRSPGSLLAGLVYLGLIGGTLYAGYSMIM
jgi:glutathione S-transferase